MITVPTKIETGQPFGLYNILVEAQDAITDIEAVDATLAGVCGATIVVGAAHTSAIAATIQLTDVNGDDMAVAGTVMAYLASDALGLDINATALTTDMVAVTDGSVAILLANKVYMLVSEANGDIGVQLGYTTGALDFYLVIVLPNGKRIVSTKFEFTA